MNVFGMSNNCSNAQVLMRLGFQNIFLIPFSYSNRYFILWKAVFKFFIKSKLIQLLQRILSVFVDFLGNILDLLVQARGSCCDNSVTNNCSAALLISSLYQRLPRKFSEFSVFRFTLILLFLVSNSTDCFW